MRTMRMDPNFVIRLSYKNGYTITNAPVDFNMIPQPENFRHPAIKVCDVSSDDGIDTVSIDESLTFPVAPIEYPIDPKFRKLVRKALHGHSRFWKLIGLEICHVGVILTFGYKQDSSKHEIVCLYPPSGETICTEFETKHEKIRLTMRAYSGGDSWHYIEVMEYSDDGTKNRKLVFNTGNCHPFAESPDDEFYDVLITEYA